jgi:FixJ family two-component response regulator
VSLVPLAHVVDDNPEIRTSLKLLLKSVEIDVETYRSADEFLTRFEETHDRPAIVLLDVRMPGMSGMALLERLRAEHAALPVIIISGHGDIDMAVRAMRLGATDFITKPFSSQTLLDRVQDVLRRSTRFSGLDVSLEEACLRFASLTAREREVFEHIVSGEANKVIAFDLGISIRTVESHRASIMEKMKARTLVDLVLVAVRLKDAGRLPG